MFTLGREREKAHAAKYVNTEADRQIVSRVVDAAHDLLEGTKSAEEIIPVLADAFVTGGSGAWEMTGSWLRKLQQEFPFLAQLWLQLADHNSARIRFRIAAFLNDMPDETRLKLVAMFLSDTSAKVRAKTAGEISMRPSADALPLLQTRLTEEVDSVALSSIQDAIAAYANTKSSIPKQT